MVGFSCRVGVRVVTVGAVLDFCRGVVVEFAVELELLGTVPHTCQMGSADTVNHGYSGPCEVKAGLGQRAVACTNTKALRELGNRCSIP